MHGNKQAFVMPCLEALLADSVLRKLLKEDADNGCGVLLALLLAIDKSPQLGLDKKLQESVQKVGWVWVWVCVRAPRQHGQDSSAACLPLLLRLVVVGGVMVAAGCVPVGVLWRWQLWLSLDPAVLCDPAVL